MKHLSKEYSTEILLSLIEFYSYKNYILLLFDLNDEKIKTHKLDNEIKTDIIETHNKQWYIKDNNELKEIYDNNDNDNDKNNNNELIVTAKCKAYDIYKKYVETGSEYEINIPSQMRDNVKNKLQPFIKWIKDENTNPLDLAKLFDECIKEQEILLTYAMARMKQNKKLYNQLLK